MSAFRIAKTKVVQNLVNSVGFKTNRKIIVFESDDWGSTRMRSKEDLEWFIRKGYKVDECPYNSNDKIESDIDLIGLMEVLSSVKDKNGDSAKFTINNIVANPNYKQIEESNFSDYFYEPFTETLKTYVGSENVINLYKEGISNKLLRPQFHGREHLNIETWLKALCENKERAILAFEKEMFTVHQTGVLSGRVEFLDAFGLDDEVTKSLYPKIIKDGLALFEHIWGFRSESFIAPTYVWPSYLEETLSRGGVKYIQGTHVQRVSANTLEEKIQRKYHYLGQRNSFDQYYLIRNAFFEPTSNQSLDWVDMCLKDIENSFFWNKPAIISSHRVNYIGGINPKNRSVNLQNLRELLEKILKKFPAVEFMFSDELGQVIKSK